MASYDFRVLNDKEFEALATDLIGASRGKRFERFKSGRDLGVDGRYFESDGGEVILQCKHWSRTSIKQLIRELAKVELAKVAVLKPKQYLIATSLELSRTEKNRITRIFEPYICRADDIYGLEDLNQLIDENPKIEKNHYKLWLSSSQILVNILNNDIQGRSDFSLKNINSTLKTYVLTENHNRALTILEKESVVIITGAPGIGKTTLAGHLCLKYISAGFQFIHVSEDINEAERVFNPDTKQIIYFDDFLGRNYLQALTGHEGKINDFIGRVAKDKKKIFVLTSRSTVFNQGKHFIEFLDSTTKSKEYELQLSLLTPLERAKILYNHMWHSSLDSSLIDQLYIDKRYKIVIQHRKFNPRIISYITDASRSEGLAADGYWAYVIDSLNDPSKIWENPFSVQTDDFGRSIIILVVVNGRSIEENVLSSAYNRLAALPSAQSMKGVRDFYSALKILTGSMLNRLRSKDDSIEIDLFDPSIGDFVLLRCVNNFPVIKEAFFSLRTTASLLTLLSMRRNKSFKSLLINDAIAELLTLIVNEGFVDVEASFLPYLFSTVVESPGSLKKVGSDRLRSTCRYLLDNFEGIDADVLKCLNFGCNEGYITAEEVIELVSSNISDIVNDDEIQATSEFLKFANTPRFLAVREEFCSHVIELASDDFDNFFLPGDVFHDLDDVDYVLAERAVTNRVEEKLHSLGLKVSQDQLNDVLGNFDFIREYDSYLERRFEDRDDDDARQISAPENSGIDPIEDLFERS